MTNLASITSQIKSEITIDGDGKGKASIRAVARLMDVDHTSLLESLKTAGGISPSKLVVMLIEQGFELQQWNTKGIPIEAIVRIAHYYGYEAGKHCSRKARSAWLYYQQNKSFQGFVYTEELTSKSDYEAKVRDNLARSLWNESPQIEVVTPAGRVDIVTDRQLIEVKLSRYWKNALGQVMVYGFYYPGHIRRIHLFGKTEKMSPGVIEHHCKELNVVLTWE